MMNLEQIPLILFQLRDRILNGDAPPLYEALTTLVLRMRTIVQLLAGDVHADITAYDQTGHRIIGMSQHVAAPDLVAAIAIAVNEDLRVSLRIIIKSAEEGAFSPLDCENAIMYANQMLQADMLEYVANNAKELLPFFGVSFVVKPEAPKPVIGEDEEG